MMTETQLAAQSGIMKRHLAEIRRAEFTVEIDYKKKGREIAYTETGLKKMREKLAAENVRESAGDEIEPSDVDDAAIAEKALSEAVERIEETRRTLIVKKCPANPRIVLCLVKGSSVPARCRVASSANLLPGMEIPDCLHIRGDYFEFTGKLPRSRGNWRRRSTATQPKKQTT